jgi:small-conductance mechanosensitive channel
MARVSELLPLAWVLGGIIVGLIAYVLVVRPIRLVTVARGWHVLQTVLSIVGTIVVLWGGLAGLYLAMDRLTLSPRQTTFLDKTIGALFIFSLMWIAARIAGASIEAFSARTQHKLFSVSLYSTLVQAAILVIGLLTVLSSVGVAIAPLLTTLGLGGLAVALALNDTLSNLFAGMQIVAARQLRIGDYVKFDFAEGEIVDIHWHNTTIRDFQNNLTIVPNSKINTSPFTNYSMCVSALVIPATANLPWKGAMDELRTIAENSARDAIAEVGDGKERKDAHVYLSAVNETNVQITALLPVGHIQNRTAAVSSFLRRLYDGALAANMGADLSG